MKKLMIAAALTAMTGAAFAIDAQVYDASFSIKTTACKEAKVSKALASYFGDNAAGRPDADADNQYLYGKGDVIGLRKQATRKMVGVIWGCDCITIANPGWRKYGANGKTVGGYAFWDPSSGEHFYIPGTRMIWSLLNRIDAMTKAEGMWSIANKINGQAFFYTGAGFGTIAGKDCSAYIKSISGNFAGFRQSINAEFGCVFCENNDCYVEPFCNGNLGLWPNCATCGNFANADALTAAYGTWNIKYNASMSKKLASKGYLSQVYKFGKATGLQAVIAKIEKLVKDGVLDEEAHSEELALDDLVAAYEAVAEDAEEEFEAPEEVDEETLGNAKAFALIDAVLEADADEPEEPEHEAE